jgi:hypothetical protein
MKFKFVFFILLINYISKPVATRSILENDLISTSLQKTVTDLIRSIYESVAALNTVSSGRRPCIWKICSKPLKKHENKIKDDNSMDVIWKKKLKDLMNGDEIDKKTMKKLIELSLIANRKMYRSKTVF